MREQLNQTVNTEFVRQTDGRGGSYWQVFEHDAEGQRIFLGAIWVRESADESYLVFIAADGEAEWLSGDSEQFFGLPIGSEFFCRMADFMRGIEKGLVRKEGD